MVFCTPQLQFHPFLLYTLQSTPTIYIRVREKGTLHPWTMYPLGVEDSLGVEVYGASTPKESLQSASFTQKGG